MATNVTAEVDVMAPDPSPAVQMLAETNGSGEQFAIMGLLIAEIKNPPDARIPKSEVAKQATRHDDAPSIRTIRDAVDRLLEQGVMVTDKNEYSHDLRMASDEYDLLIDGLEDMLRSAKYARDKNTAQLEAPEEN